MKDKETKEFGKEWQDEQREKMVRIQFPKTIQKIEQEAERRGYKRGLVELKGVLSNALKTGAITENPELEIKRVIIDIELLEEENGKQE